jgi:hypothetical protein
VSEVQVACCHLMQHRGEKEKIIDADHGDLKIGITAPLEFKGSTLSWCRQSLLFPDRDCSRHLPRIALS